MSTKDALQHAWALYSMQGDQNQLYVAVQVFLDLHRKHLPNVAGTSSNVGQFERPNETVVSGPHLSILPDGFLHAISRSLHRFVDVFLNDPSAAWNDLEHVSKLVSCLIIISRNVDNLAQLTSSTAIGDSLAIAQSCWTEQAPASTCETSTEALLRYVLTLVQTVYDPYGLWIQLTKNQALRSDASIAPPNVHHSVITLLLKIFREPIITQRASILESAVSTLGCVMAGSKFNGVQVTSEITWSSLLAVLVDSSVSEERQTILDSLVLCCCKLFVHTLCEAPAERRLTDVQSILAAYLHTMRSLSPGAVTVRKQLAMLEWIQDNSGTAVIQAVLITVGLFEQLLQMIQQGADVVEMHGGLLIATAAVRVLGSLLKSSDRNKALFEERIGYRMLSDVLLSISEPNEEFVRSLFELSVDDHQPPGVSALISNPNAAVILLRHCAVFRDVELQKYTIRRFRELLSTRKQNRALCCSAGMVDAILDVLMNQTKVMKIAEELIQVLELLLSYSVTPGQFRRILQLLKSDGEGFQPSYLKSLVHVLSSVVAHDVGKEPFRCFDLRNDCDGLEPINLRGRWPGQGFSFHAWICLDQQLTVSQQKSDPFLRRTLYSVTNQEGFGFEAFFSVDGTLVIAVSLRKEYVVMSLESLTADEWHCVDIVHSGPKRPFGNSTLTVYIDGRHIHATTMKMPPLNDPFVSCKIGCGPPQLQRVTDIASHVSHLTLAKSPSEPMRRSLPSRELVTVQKGSQNHIFGHPASLKGQINNICIFFEALTPQEIKELHDGGTNLTFQSEDGTGLSPKLWLHYNGNACHAGYCVDLSSQRKSDAIFRGTLLTAWRITNAISSIGGVTSLLPLLEQADKPLREFCEVHRSSDSRTDGSFEISDTAEDQTDWVVLDRKSSLEKMNENPAAAFLDLLRKTILKNAEFREEILLRKAFAIIGHILGRLDAQKIDVDLLFSVQLLIESAQTSETPVEFLDQIYHHVLLAFNAIWAKVDFTIRLGHIQYVRKLVKEDKKYFRRKYGVQFFLDVLRTFHTQSSPSSLSLTEEEAGILRKHVYGLIMEFINQSINHAEISAIIRCLLTVKCPVVVEGLLDILIASLEGHSKSDQIFLLMFEPHAADSLFCLLLRKSCSPTIRAKLLSIFRSLLNSGKVYEKSKIRLRFLGIGISGILSIMPEQPPLDFMKVYLDQYLSNSLEHPGKYGSILSIYSMLQTADLMMKLDLSRKFLMALYMKPGAASHIAHQPGWYHSLASLLVESPIAPSPEDAPSKSNLIDLKSPEEAPAVQEMYSDFSEADTISASEQLIPEDTVDRVSRFSDDISLRSESGFVGDLGIGAGDLDRSSLQSRHQSLANEYGLGDNARRSPSLNGNYDIIGKELLSILDDPIHSTRRSDSASDDLCTVILNLLSTVMWQGIEGSGPAVWIKRAEIFVSLDMLALTNHLYRSTEELKRRLYETALQAAASEFRKDPLKVSNIENAELLIRLVHDFATAPDLQRSVESKLSSKLLEEFSSLLDVTRVWESSSTTEGWTEMIQIAMDLFLTVLRCPDLTYCSVIIPKLHYVLERRITASRREICYVLAALNDHLSSALDMSNQDHLLFIIPVLRIVLEKWAIPLSTARYLKEIPSLTHYQQSLQSLQKYFRTPEWGNFIATVVNPLAVDYVNAVCKPRKERMGEFWNEAHDAAMAQLHNRNKLAGESKLKFQQEYVDPAKKLMQEEMGRYSARQMEEKAEMATAARLWDEQKRYLFRKRGPWCQSDQNNDDVPLKMSGFENVMRMRLRLVENPDFNSYEEAAQLRDNTAPLPTHGLELPVIAAKRNKLANADSEESLFNEEHAEPPSPASKPVQPGTASDLRERHIKTEDCCLITVTEIVHGRFELTSQRVKFHAVNPAYDSKNGECHSFEIPLGVLQEVQLRRYNLRKTALEIFLVDQTNYFFNFGLHTRNEIYRKIIANCPSGLIYSKYSSPAAQFRASNITQRWVQREISNFEYLMALNTLAGRTYNDLSQYPVFPWVLRDYRSEALDLDNPEVFRRLGAPMGIQNPKHEKEVRSKFENFEDPSGIIEPFHYGQHYSNPASVIHYLIRIEPYTSLHIQLQSGRFDVADRQFHSIANTWDLLWGSPNDVKELIPEFFYLPEFLENLDGFDFGRLQQSKERVSDVILPLWAKSPEEFVYLHRRALESDYVSEHLNEWIDLIFGYKQQGPAAVEALNVFYYCTYEGAVDLEAITDPTEKQATEGMINNFGQTPCQLLTEPHPRRLGFQEATKKFATVEGRMLNLFQFTRFLKAFLVEANIDGDPVLCLAVARVQPRGVLQVTTKCDLITVGKSGAIGVHAWTPYDRNSPKNMIFERDPVLLNQRFTRNIAQPFHPAVAMNPNLFAFSSDLKLLAFGGSWDSTLGIYSFVKSKVVARLARHKDTVTCVSVDSLGLRLVSGSRDTTCIIWEILQQNGSAVGVNTKPLQTLYGHVAEVTSVAISVEFDIVVSSSKDSTIIIHTVRNGLYVRTLRPARQIVPSPRNTVEFVGLTYDGKIVSSCVFPDDKNMRNSLELYSVNGKHLFSEKLGAPASHFVLADEYIVTGDAEGRVEIREWFQLRLLYSVQLGHPISSLYVPRSNSHILAGLSNGKLIIITVPPNIAELSAS